MGSFTVTPEGLAASRLHGRIVARAMEIDPDAWAGYNVKMYLPEQQTRQMMAMNQAAVEIVAADEKADG